MTDPSFSQFFRLKVSDDIRAILRTSNLTGLRDRKFKRVSKVEHMFHSTMNLSSDRSDPGFAQDRSCKHWKHKSTRPCFGPCIWKERQTQMGVHEGSFYVCPHVPSCLSNAYSCSLIKPMLFDPNAPIPSRIILADKKSRPPVYSPELKALLTSGHSRTTKALELQSLTSPPKLSLRADPCSEDTRLLGPLSKRREVNIRWRYFVTEWKKIRPPLQVVVKDMSNEVVHNRSTKEDVRRAGIRGFGMQGFGVFEEIETLVGPPWIPKAPTRRERELGKKATYDSTSHIPRHPSRWLRRRYQELLGRMPVLTYTRTQNVRTEGYSVSLSHRAIAPWQRYTANRLAEIDIVNLAWLEQADSEDEKAGLRSQTPKQIS